MFCLGFWMSDDSDDDDEPGWSYEFITDDFVTAVENLADAREDASNGVYLWYGATLMVLVRLDNGVEEWQPLFDNIVKEATDDTEDTTS